jgi:hypothetical protein
MHFRDRVAYCGWLFHFFIERGLWQCYRGRFPWKTEPSGAQKGTGRSDPGGKVTDLGLENSRETEGFGVFCVVFTVTICDDVNCYSLFMSRRRSWIVERHGTSRRDSRATSPSHGLSICPRKLRRRRNRPGLQNADHAVCDASPS